YGAASADAQCTASMAAGDLTGHFRNPVPLSDGTVVVSHTPVTTVEQNGHDPTLLYVFRLAELVPRFPGDLTKTENVAGPYLTGAGLVKHVLWWDNGALREYDGPLSETDTVEVRPRPRPTARTEATAAVEAQLLVDE